MSLEVTALLSMRPTAALGLSMACADRVSLIAEVVLGVRYQLGDVHAPRVKGDFGRVHGERASFAINLIVREGEHGPRDYPMCSVDSESLKVRCDWRRRHTIR